MTATAIAAVVPRRRTTVEGRISNVTARSSPWKRLDVVLEDDTGTITVRFLGRDVVPGMFVDRWLSVEGTAAWKSHQLVMLNPLYRFVGRAPSR